MGDSQGGSHQTRPRFSMFVDIFDCNGNQLEFFFVTENESTTNWSMQKERQVQSNHKAVAKRRRVAGICKYAAVKDACDGCCATVGGVE